MSSEETNVEESADSLSAMSSLDDGFVRMQFKSVGSDGKVTGCEKDWKVWSEIEAEPADKFLKDNGIVAKETPTF